MKIKNINTSSEAEIFAKQVVSDPKIYFLQGKWGSGKTEYLKKIKTYLPEKYVVVDLELWRPKNKDSIEKKLFSAIYPKLSKFIYWLGWIFIVMSVIGSILLSIMHILPVGYRTFNLSLVVTAIAIIFSTLYGFLQSKWIDIDKILLNWCILSLKSTSKPKLLIIDDFDRIDVKLQNELYLIFNALHNGTRIIFVGDLNRVKNVKNNYLGKIIDKKIALPFSLNSRNVVSSIKNTILDELDQDFDFSCVERLFVSEKRTTRDANQFLTYVEFEFINQAKVNKVQIDQQLFVIYLYLFHPKKYLKLLGGWLPDEKIPSSKDENEVGELEKYMCIMFQPRNSNPPDFRKNTSFYFVNELANNHSVIELRKVITDDGSILKNYFYESDVDGSKDYTEFLDFVQNFKSEEYRESKIILERHAILAMHSEIRHVPNSLIKYIFTHRSNEAISDHWERKTKNEEYKDDNDLLFEKFENIFKAVEKIKIKDTEKMYFYRSCLNLFGKVSYKNSTLLRELPAINEENVMKYFKNKASSIEENINFGSESYDAEAIIVQLGYSYWLDGPIDPKINPDFLSKIESIEKLSSEEYRYFWKVYNILPTTDKDGKTVLRGGGVLNFEYQESNYKQHVLQRLNN